MELKGKTVLVFGAGKSGIGAAGLLADAGALPVLYDGNEKLTEEAVRKSLSSSAADCTQIVLKELPDQGFDSGTVSCITRQESFLYYVMNQPREIRTAEVGLFDLGDNALAFYEFQMKRDKRKLFVRVDQEEMKEAFALSVPDRKRI